MRDGGALVEVIVLGKEEDRKSFLLLLERAKQNSNRVEILNPPRIGDLLVVVIWYLGPKFYCVGRVVEIVPDQEDSFSYWIRTYFLNEAPFKVTLNEAVR